MKKRFIACALLFSIALSCMTIAHAASVRTITSTAGLAFSGTTATCSVTISEPGKTISATLQLWQGNTLVSSWSASNSSVLYISRTHSVSRGKTYTVKAAYTINGTTHTVTPVTKTCP